MRDEADASCAAPRLTLEEKAAIAERHAKKQLESQKRGMAVMLRDIMANRVSTQNKPQVWIETYNKSFYMMASYTGNSLRWKECAIYMNLSEPGERPNYLVSKSEGKNDELLS